MLTHSIFTPLLFAYTHSIQPRFWHSCNEEITNFELFLERKYPRGRGYFVCSKCQKVRDKKIIKELAHSISDLSFYDYPKTIANYKKQEEE